MASVIPKIILITGASSGIGRAVALRMASTGASLALTGLRPEKLAVTVSAVKAAFPDTKVYARDFDIRDDASVREFVAEVVGELGPPCALVHCAGGNPVRGRVGSLEPSAWDAAFALNCRATASVVRACWPHWISGGGGRCVVVVSSSALFATEGNGPYAASKAAQKALCDTLRKEGRPDGIGVCAVYPGGVDTDFRPQSRPEYMRAESVAEAVALALSLPSDAMMHEMVLRPPCEANHV